MLQPTNIMVTWLNACPDFSGAKWLCVGVSHRGFGASHRGFGAGHRGFGAGHRGFGAGTEILLIRLDEGTGYRVNNCRLSIINLVEIPRPPYHVPRTPCVRLRILFIVMISTTID
jgi:hypothetical protein